MANNPLNGIVYQLKESCGSVEGDLLSGEIHHNEQTPSDDTASESPVAADDKKAAENAAQDIGAASDQFELVMLANQKPVVSVLNSTKW